MTAIPYRLHWCDAPQAVPPPSRRDTTVVHDSLMLYQSLLDQDDCESVELTRVHCFCHTTKGSRGSVGMTMMLGLQVVYASTFGDGRVLETASSRLVFPAFFSQEGQPPKVVQRVTLELDVGDYIVGIEPHNTLGTHQCLVTGVTFVTYKGRRETVGQSNPSSLLSTEIENERQITPRKIVALKGTSGREYGVLQQIGYYVVPLVPSIMGHNCKDGKESTEVARTCSMNRYLCFHELHMVCNKSQSKRKKQRFLQKRSSSTKELLDTSIHALDPDAPISHAHQMLCSTRVDSKQSNGSSSRRNDLDESQYSELSFYQRLWGHSSVINVQLHQICIYHTDNNSANNPQNVGNNAILRLFGVYRVTQTATAGNGSDSCVTTATTAEHSAWKEQQQINSTGAAGSTCSIVTLEPREYVCSLSGNSPIISAPPTGGRNDSRFHLTSRRHSSRPPAITTVTLTTNRRRITIHVNPKERTTKGDMESTHLEDHGFDSNDSRHSGTRRVVAFAGTIQRGGLARIGYVTEATNWQVLKPWLMLRHSLTLPSGAHGASVTPVRTTTSADKNILKWKAFLETTAGRKLFRRPLLMIQGKQKRRQCSSSPSKPSVTATPQLKPEECLMQKMMADTNQDIFCHILSYLAPSPTVAG